jgi:hypothetical protein
VVEVEGMINHAFTILIDSGASHSYIDPKFVDRFLLRISKHEKYWLVQLDIGAKIKVV